MTEAEWLGCHDSRPLLDFLRGRGTDRKFRLFAVACCRTILTDLSDDSSRITVEVAEGYADGLCSETALREASVFAHRVGGESDLRPLGEDPARYRARKYAALAATQTANRSGVWQFATPGYCAAVATATAVACAVKFAGRARRTSGRPVAKKERRRQSLLVKDIFGNPFRSPTFDPAWRTRTTMRMAASMYEDRVFAAMPILADALGDAGCADSAILDHCCGTGPHVRGCWVVDLLLGKT